VATVQGDLASGDLLPEAPGWAVREIARAQRELPRARGGIEAGANALSYGLARLLAATEPAFFVPGTGFTQLEARFDRGIGMLLRPPSRLFADAGLETSAARAMPIRLDASGGSMGGAHMPPPLVPRFRALLERRMDRLARRMTESELDAPALIGVLIDAAAYAADRGLGLVEAADVIVPGVPESEPPDLRLIAPDRKRLDRDLRRRLEEASRPPSEPGLLARLFGRKRGSPPSSNPGENGRRWGGMNDVTPPPDPAWGEQETPREGRPE
jgi:predicted NBD/HSP70 family sugar kinase